MGPTATHKMRAARLGGWIAKRAAVLIVTVSGALAAPVPAQAQTVSEQEAHAIGVDAYVHLYPLVTMDITRKQAINIEPRQGVRPPTDEHVRQRAGIPPANFRDVVRSNFDTLYSIAWLDMTKEPMIVSGPDTHDRYYMLPMLDMWSDVFASSGSRTDVGTEPVVPSHPDMGIDH